MVSKNLLAVAGLVAAPVMANEPESYRYGKMTDAAMSMPSAEDFSIPSAILPITVTESITMTNPVTVTQTVTVSQADCEPDSDVPSTTHTTVTSRNTVTVSASKSISSSIVTSPPDNMTEPCDPTTTSNVEGVTGTSTQTVSLSPTRPVANSTTGIVVTHTPTPITVPTSMGTKSQLHLQFVAGALSLVSLGFVLAF
ncbi:hypothetical protein GGS21DRAFT_548037 [Xylaria nigripes]|nr:hypothetical protein GGS21DRAFT_548037 [Xylaria nigripes]